MIPYIVAVFNLVLVCTSCSSAWPLAHSLVRVPICSSERVFPFDYLRLACSMHLSFLYHPFRMLLSACATSWPAAPYVLCSTLVRLLFISRTLPSLVSLSSSIRFRAVIFTP
ncbi:uncharacterized protein C8Q71DRAFT_780991 [Rhodofomes roseus]|uniref:Secreted peptide n=1 Tax=Rhodofomes roseus TaxID=34475 RepID=A0ABQ8K3W7_9APHY|nr:uncharacterized protein C8Q71DRAFT_780991 [Rhodofomes roseus]KAH9831525.1 hypothetical protein C8Q71DRAFT_780991 [Rhodofomes roseus]